MRFTNVLVGLTLLLTLNLTATTYEDGEDREISRWHLLNKPSEEATIENIYDNVKGSHVIKFKGDGTKSAYLLMSDEGATWNNKKEKVLHWQMNYEEDFVILVSLETKRGKRYLIYTPGTENGYMQYGLGDNATEGGWQRYSRNLEKDLNYFDNQNSIIEVKSFVIRGSGLIDNVKLMKGHRVEEDSDVVSKKNSKKVSKKVSKKSLKKRVFSKKRKFHSKSKKHLLKREGDTTPKIIMEGENPLFLSLGESFDEPGVRAEDKEDGELVVTSSENIDKYKEGIYAVIYMATDSNGNSAIDKRYVHIGEAEESDGEESESVAKSVKEENGTEVSSDDKEIDDDDAQYRLEERELEIAEWEKELQLREKEISQREQNIQKSVETSNQMQ